MTKSLKLPKISVKALFPSAALKHGHNETLQMRMRHNNRIARAGGRSKNLSRNPEKRIDQLLERERIRKSRKIEKIIEKRKEVVKAVVVVVLHQLLFLILRVFIIYVS